MVDVYCIYCVLMSFLCQLLNAFMRNFHDHATNTHIHRVVILSVEMVKDPSASMAQSSMMRTLR